MTTLLLDPTTDTVASVPRSSRPFQRRQYRDKQFLGGEQEWSKKVDSSSTVYVGNLSCYTNEYQLHELFSRCGSVKRIIMGLDRFQKKPCGFCFVEYDERTSALKSVKYLSKTHLDGRDIQIDIDAGFQEGRQYGRGQSGGQISDERRRERESKGGYAARGGSAQGSGAMLTRSITIVACLTMISLIITIQSEAATMHTDLGFMPFGGLLGPGYGFGHYNPYMMRLDDKASRLRQAQFNEQRKQLEIDLAQFLVNLMKSAKPTLLKAFIKATLADKQLKETAIGLFFGSGDEESEESKEDEDSDKEKDKKKDGEESSSTDDKDKHKRKRKRGSRDKIEK